MKQINVVGAIIIQNDKVFCAKRGPGRSLENYWEFPGGKIEAGETAHESLGRELKEELKIEVEMAEDIFDTSSYVYSFGQVNLTTVLCHLMDGQPVLTEHVDMAWLPIDQLATLDWAPADIPAVVKLGERNV